MDDLLAALGSFFGTLRPKDWITAALSLAAVSISLIALRQVAVNRPRSNLELEWPGRDKIESGEYATVYVKLFNHGSRPARDVKVDVSSLVGASGKHWLLHNEIPEGERWGFRIPVEVVTLDNFGERPRVVPASNERVGVSLIVTARWRRENSNRWQTRKWRVVEYA